MGKSNQSDIRRSPLIALCDITIFGIPFALAVTPPLLLVLCNITIFGMVFAMLSLSYQYSLTCVALTVVVLLFMEKKGHLHQLYSLYIQYRKLASVSALVCILILPVMLAGMQYESHIAVMAIIYAMVCLGLNFQMGSTNMVNFAPAAFMGIGAYSMAVATVKMEISPWLGLLAAMVFCVFAGLIIGLPTLRTKSYYLSLVTMALQLAFTQLIRNIAYMGGPNGISGVKRFAVGEFSLYGRHTLPVLGRVAPHFFFLYFCIAVLIVLVYIAMRVNVSRSGLALNTIAQDEIAANCLGVNVSRQKLFAFVIGSVFCGIGGALYASLTSFVGPGDFTFPRSLVFICMVILGGMDNSIGVLIGAFLLTVVTEKLRPFADYSQLVYALLLVVILIVRPSGLIPKRVRDYCVLFKRQPRQMIEQSSVDIT